MPVSERLYICLPLSNIQQLCSLDALCDRDPATLGTIYLSRGIAKGGLSILISHELEINAQSDLIISDTLMS